MCTESGAAPAHLASEGSHSVSQLLLAHSSCRQLHNTCIASTPCFISSFSTSLAIHNCRHINKNGEHIESYTCTVVLCALHCHNCAVVYLRGHCQILRYTSSMRVMPVSVPVPACSSALVNHNIQNPFKLLAFKHRYSTCVSTSTTVVQYGPDTDAVHTKRCTSTIGLAYICHTYYVCASATSGPQGTHAMLWRDAPC